MEIDMAMTKDVARRRGRADGERLVAQFERSGLGRRAFCAARSIPVNTLDYWRRRLRQEAPVRSGFVELMPVAATTGASDGWDVELTLGGGLVLRLRRGV
jgi:hypothetical protein